MINAVESHASDPRDWPASELHKTLEQRRPLRTLVLSGRPEALESQGVSAPCSVRVLRAGEPAWQAVRCEATSLPFQLDVFDLVVLHEIVRQDDERVLAEVRRSMPGGSQLLVLGSARWSLAALAGKSDGHRSFRPGWLRERLGQFGFLSERALGRGVFGLDRVVGPGWQSVFLPVSDQLSVRARRSEARPNVRLVRFSRPKAAVGRATAMDSLNRESAS